MINDMKRLNEKAALLPKQGDNFLLLCADGAAKLAGEGQVFRISIHVWDPPDEGKEHHAELQEADRSDLPKTSINR